MCGNRVLADLMPTERADITGRIVAAVTVPLAETGSTRWSSRLIKKIFSLTFSVV